MLEWFQDNLIVRQVIFLGLVILGVIVLKKNITQWISSLADKKQVSIQRRHFILKSINGLSLLVLLSLLAVFLDIGFGDVSLFLSSIFAVLGVALFAQWSILSNITASILIFFVFPYRIGDYIQVVEKDADIRGKIVDITMFHVMILHQGGETISYPSNLILQKSVIKLRKDEVSTIVQIKSANVTTEPNENNTQKPEIKSS